MKQAKKKTNLGYVTMCTIAISIYIIILFVVSTKHIMSLNECFDILKTSPEMVTSIINLNANSWHNYLYIERILGAVGVLLIIIHAFSVNALLKLYRANTLQMLAGNVKKTEAGENKQLERKIRQLETELENAKNELITKEILIEELTEELKR